MRRVSSRELDLLILTYLLLLLGLLRLTHNVLLAHPDRETLLQATVFAEATVVHRHRAAAAVGAAKVLLQKNRGRMCWEAGDRGRL